MGGVLINICFGPIPLWRWHTPSTQKQYDLDDVFAFLKKQFLFILYPLRCPNYIFQNWITQFATFESRIQNVKYLVWALSQHENVVRLPTCCSQHGVQMHRTWNGRYFILMSFWFHSNFISTKNKLQSLSWIERSSRSHCSPQQHRPQQHRPQQHPPLQHCPQRLVFSISQHLFKCSSSIF